MEGSAALGMEALGDCGVGLEERGNEENQEREVLHHDQDVGGSFECKVICSGCEI